ncbi:MAG: hypothetical protein ACJA1P_002371 [Maribacter sp.]
MSNYLIYAIGEIVLVVIGILIALQINNWNENTKLEIEETRLLKQLNIEFKNNKKALKLWICSLPLFVAFSADGVPS